MSFQLVPKLVTLNGVMALILRYFSKIGSFWGALPKSSCSLSHLLMSSCCVSMCTSVIGILNMKPNVFWAKVC